MSRRRISSFTKERLTCTLDLLPEKRMVVTQRDYTRHFRDMQLGKVHPDKYGVWTVRHYAGGDSGDAKQTKLVSPTRPVSRKKHNRKRGPSDTPPARSKKRRLITKRGKQKVTKKSGKSTATKKNGTGKNCERVKTTKRTSNKTQHKRGSQTTKYPDRVRQF